MISVHILSMAFVAVFSGSARGCDDSGTFCHSSISDKMSDYEDIWSSNGETMSRGAAQASASSKGNNLPGACNRDHRSSSAMSSSAADRPMTPAESESHLKTYLASKLLSGQCELESSQVSCPSLVEDKMESSQFSVITEDFGGISTTSARTGHLHSFMIFSRDRNNNMFYKF